MSKKKVYEVELLKEWMSRLGLMDWSIVLTAGCSPCEMAISGTLGCTSWEESTKSAVIQIVDPDQIGGEPTREFNFEEVLVHELLHLKTCLLSSKEPEETISDRILHQLIDDLARAMVDIKKTERAKNGKVSDLRRGNEKADPQNKT